MLLDRIENIFHKMCDLLGTVSSYKVHERHYWYYLRIIEPLHISDRNDACLQSISVVVL